jgi:hypothetical protein
MESHMRSAFAFLARTPALRALSVLGAFSVLAPQAKTLEGFNVNAGIVGSLNNPVFWITEDMGHGYVFVGPSVDLFENRLSLHLDLGVSDRIFFSRKDFWLRKAYRTTPDTLFETRDWAEFHQKVTQGYCAYKAALNFGAWSVFAGELIQFRIYRDVEEGNLEESYATAGNLDAFTVQSAKPYTSENIWESGLVFPIYGVARRFGRVSFWAQGVSLFSVQAGVGISLKPLGPIAPHR